MRSVTLLILLLVLFTRVSYSVDYCSSYLSKTEVKALKGVFVFEVRTGNRAKVYKITSSEMFEKEGLELGKFLVDQTNSTLIDVVLPAALYDVPELLKPFVGPDQFGSRNDIILVSDFIEDAVNDDTGASEEVARLYHREAERIFNWVRNTNPSFMGFPVKAKLHTSLTNEYELGVEEGMSQEEVYDNIVNSPYDTHFQYKYWTFTAGPYMFYLTYDGFREAKVSNQKFDGQKYWVFDPW